MNPLEKAKRHFENQGMKSLVVPEWTGGDEDPAPVRIFYKPITGSARAEIQKKVNEGHTYSVAALVVMSLNEDGSRMFRPMDIRDIKSCFDVKVVDRVAEKILLFETVEDQEKN